MIDWEAIEPALVTIFTALSGVAATRWEGAPGMMPNPADGTTCDLSVISVVGIGHDELLHRRPDANTPPGVGLDPWGGSTPALVETARGWREIVIRAKVTSAHQSPGYAARVFLERIRDRLRWSDVRTALRDVGLGFNQIAASVDLSQVIDKRMRSIAAIDVRFNAISEAINPAGMPSIETFTLGQSTT